MLQRTGRSAYSRATAEEFLARPPARDPSFGVDRCGCVSRVGSAAVWPSGL